MSQAAQRESLVQVGKRQTNQDDIGARIEAKLLKLENEVCSHGDTVHYAKTPKVFARCEGSYLYDLSDQPYLDLQMWYSAVNLGYANQRINNAAKEQLDTLPQVASQYLHREKIELAAMIAGANMKRFGEKGRVHFNVGGSQAIEDALKLIRKSTGRSHMYAYQGGYHGRTLGASAITSSFRYREPFGEFGDRAEFVPYPYCFRCPYGKKRDSCDLYCAKQFEKNFEHEYTGAWNPKTKHAEFGAFFIEPMQGTGGYIVPPEGYFPRIAEACKAHGILVIDDEIQMGFFRTGKLWGIEHFGITPDIIVFGKALTNGLNPLSGIWAKENLISPEKFGPGSTHSTFASNPMGTRVGLEVMKVFEEGDYENEVKKKGAYFKGLFEDLKRTHPEIGHIDGLGLALRAEICQADGFTPNQPLCDALFQRGLRGGINVDGVERGLVLDIGGYYKNTITLAPSLEISYEEMDLAHDMLDYMLREAKGMDKGAH
jgi:4-aminobutyrate aminotransferase-like enzyme